MRTLSKRISIDKYLSNLENFKDEVELDLHYFKLNSKEILEYVEILNSHLDISKDDALKIFAAKKDYIFTQIRGEVLMIITFPEEKKERTARIKNWVEATKKKIKTKEEAEKEIANYIRHNETDYDLERRLLLFKKNNKDFTVKEYKSKLEEIKQKYSKFDQTQKPKFN